MRFFFVTGRIASASILAVAAVIAASLACAAGNEAGAPPFGNSSGSFQFPGLQAVPAQPGSGTFGPQGPQAKAPAAGRRDLDLEGTGSADKAAGDLSGQAPARPKKPQSPTEARREILDQLFDRLGKSTDSDEATGIAHAIERVWMRSGSDTADLLMDRAMTAMHTKDYTLAQNLLDAIVKIDPGWAEGWNRRATARFFADDYSGAMADLSHVLAIEPRHFGALTGMGFILQRTGFHKEALRVFRKALEIDPQMEDIRKLVDRLTIEVEGRDI